jgi:hypothetical protein
MPQLCKAVWQAARKIPLFVNVTLDTTAMEGRAPPADLVGQMQNPQQVVRREAFRIQRHVPVKLGTGAMGFCVPRARFALRHPLQAISALLEVYTTVLFVLALLDTMPPALIPVLNAKRARCKPQHVTLV